MIAAGGAITTLADLVRHTPEGGSVVVPRSLAAAIVDAAAAPLASPEGTGPGGDFTAADLRRRFHRSASWVRERISAGDFGEPYSHGRERIAPREGVLAYESALRWGGSDAAAMPGGAAAGAAARESRPQHAAPRRARRGTLAVARAGAGG
jgi:hypothetical protein